MKAEDRRGRSANGPDDAEPPDEDRIEELAALRDPASDQFAGRVSRAVDRVDAAATIGDFSGGVLMRVLLEMASLLLGLFAVKDQPRTEGANDAERE